MHESGNSLEPSRQPVRAFVSLGSNIGDREENVLTAIRALQDERTSLVAASHLYETEPIDLEDQPWFINAVAELSTTRTPRELLKRSHQVEQSLGRERDVRFGPRTIDIDLLLYGSEILSEPDLAIPHPRMTERRFVLVPLVELAPNLVDPRSGDSFADVLERLDEGKKVLRSAITES